MDSDIAPAVGIDLGTTYSCVGVYRNGRVEIIPNEEGNRITPSYVAFTDTERLIGDAAKNQDALNPTNTVFDVKRLIGRKFNDPTVQADIINWSFRVINEDNKPKVSVQYKGEEKIFFPEEISSMILGKMKNIAETYLGKTVKNAVVTVPAYFNDSQRQATKDAAFIAGINVLRVINEPTAAALAYGLGSECDDERNVLIFDLGGGTFDVTVLSIEENIFEVRSTAGDTHLGGEDFDNRLVVHFIEEFKRKFGKDLKTCKKAIRRLRTACERAKRVLSTSLQASIDLNLLLDDIHFVTTITRARFEELNEDLFKSTLDLVKKALSDAQMTVSDINDVVLVGGSTRIPMVQKLLQDFFGGKKLNMSVNPDEAVAYGASVQAAILEGDQSEELLDVVLLDVTPLSIGINSEDTTATFIRRNTSIPTTATLYCTTARNNQTSVDIEVLEGERALAKDNNVLGRFTLHGIPPAPRDVPIIEVTYHIDADGILHVSAIEKSKNNQKKITIQNEKGRLTKEQIEKMVLEGELYKNDDVLRRKTIFAKNSLEYYCSNTKAKVKNLKDQVRGLIREMVMGYCDDAKLWIDANPDRTLEDYQRKLKELEDLCEPLMNPGTSL